VTADSENIFVRLNIICFYICIEVVEFTSTNHWRLEHKGFLK